MTLLYLSRVECIFLEDEPKLWPRFFELSTYRKDISGRFIVNRTTEVGILREKVKRKIREKIKKTRFDQGKKS